MTPQELLYQITMSSAGRLHFYDNEENYIDE